jgi:hypothetical protein
VVALVLGVLILFSPLGVLLGLGSVSEVIAIR